MGVQRGGAKKTNGEFNYVEFSPRFRSKKVQEELRSQIINLCKGNIIEFNELMRCDVSTYLLKFEMSIKQSKKDGIG